ncbi:MAG: hypothetical protein IT456_16530 [Planctomycetes bacterium]|nr:hypothetical protein [Planctomycetota bacterium]
MVSIMITAGPTREYLDDVRFLSNGSSGRMGCALAEAARTAGHAVCLVLGPVDLAPPSGVTVFSVTSALEMQAAAEAAFQAADILIAAAAVADYRPLHRVAGKPAKQGERVTLELVPNPDIVAGLAAKRGRRVVVGFALESVSAGMAAAIARGRDKLRRKQLDLVVVNLHDAIGGVSSDVVLCYADGRDEALGLADKNLTAAHIVHAAVELWMGRQAT